jgi:dihydrofolate reductase
MRKLIVFNNISLDGYFVDGRGDMSWAHKQDPEWIEFISGNANPGGALLFGRVTYDLMSRYWPTPLALQNNASVAEGMNNCPKVVFSRTMAQAEWNNTTLIKTDIAAAVRKMKSEPGPGMAILGSGSIVAQLAPEGLIDEYQIVVNPIALGSGRTLFQGMESKLKLKLTNTRAFANGNVVLYYEPGK